MSRRLPLIRPECWTNGKVLTHKGNQFVCDDFNSFAEPAHPADKRAAIMGATRESKRARPLTVVRAVGTAPTPFQFVKFERGSPNDKDRIGILYIGKHHFGWIDQPHESQLLPIIRRLQQNGQKYCALGNALWLSWTAFRRILGRRMPLRPSRSQTEARQRKKIAPALLPGLKSTQGGSRARTGGGQARSITAVRPRLRDYRRDLNARGNERNHDRGDCDQVGSRKGYALKDNRQTDGVATGR